MDITKKAFILPKILLSATLALSSLSYVNTAKATEWYAMVDFGMDGYWEDYAHNWLTRGGYGSFNGTYRYLSLETGDGSRIGAANWAVVIPYSGYYSVTISWYATANRTANANYGVTNSDGILEAIPPIDQRSVGHGAWTDTQTISPPLGFHYNAGQIVYVRLDGTDAGDSDSSDATIWRLLAEDPPPLPPPPPPPEPEPQDFAAPARIILLEMERETPPVPED